jgi:hypothetical protein
MQTTKIGKPGLTCQVTAYYVEDPPYDGVFGPHAWMAIATAHIYDPEPDTGGRLNAETAILAGAVMRTFHARSSAMTQKAAMEAAMAGLLEQLEWSKLCPEQWFESR